MVSDGSTFTLQFVLGEQTPLTVRHLSDMCVSETIVQERIYRPPERNSAAQGAERSGHRFRALTPTAKYGNCKKRC